MQSVLKTGLSMGKRKRQPDAEASLQPQLHCNEGLDEAEPDVFLPSPSPDSDSGLFRCYSSCSDQTVGPSFRQELAQEVSPYADKTGDEDQGISLADLPQLPAGSFLPRLSESFGFSDLAIRFGGSYFHRMAQYDQILHASASADPLFVPLVQGLQAKPRQDLKRYHFSRANLLATFTACVHLAAKLLEDVRPLPLLQQMLQTIFQAPITREETEALEAHCLHALDWRLGPFYND